MGQHVISFAINIDDTDIKNKIEQSVKAEVIKKVSNKISESMVNDWGNLNRVSKDIITMTMEKYQDKIIDTAVNDVTNIIKRSKKYKEALKTISESVKEENE